MKIEPNQYGFNVKYKKKNLSIIPNQRISDINKMSYYFEKKCRKRYEDAVKHALTDMFTNNINCQNIQRSEQP